VSDLKEKAKNRQNQMGPGVVPIVQRYIAREGVSQVIALQNLVDQGRIRRVNGTYQLVK